MVYTFNLNVFDFPNENDICLEVSVTSSKQIYRIYDYKIDKPSEDFNYEQERNTKTDVQVILNFDDTNKVKLNFKNDCLHEKHFCLLYPAVNIFFYKKEFQRVTLKHATSSENLKYIGKLHIDGIKNDTDYVYKFNYEGETIDFELINGFVHILNDTHPDEYLEEEKRIYKSNKIGSNPRNGIKETYEIYPTKQVDYLKFWYPLVDEIIMSTDCILNCLNEVLLGMKITEDMMLQYLHCENWDVQDTILNKPDQTIRNTLYIMLCRFLTLLPNTRGYVANNDTHNDVPIGIPNNSENGMWFVYQLHHYLKRIQTEDERLKLLIDVNKTAGTLLICMTRDKSTNFETQFGDNFFGILVSDDVRYILTKAKNPKTHDRSYLYLNSTKMQHCYKERVFDENYPIDNSWDTSKISRIIYTNKSTVYECTLTKNPNNSNTEFKCENYTLNCFNKIHIGKDNYLYLSRLYLRPYQTIELGFDLFKILQCNFDYIEEICKPLNDDFKIKKIFKTYVVEPGEYSTAYGNERIQDTKNAIYRIGVPVKYGYMYLFIVYNN